MKNNLKKLNIPIGILFEKLGIKHKDILEEETHLPPCDVYVETKDNKIKINYFVTKRSDTFEYKLENGKSIKCSDKHLIQENRNIKLINEAERIDNKDGNSYKIVDKKFLTKNDIVYDFSIDEPHLYITPDGSIHHNTTVSFVMFLYDLARMLCLESPQTKYRLQTSAKITGLLINSTIEQAMRVNYDPIIAMIRNSPFFVSKFNNKTKNSLFINNIDIVVATRKRGIVGQNVFTFLADEVARMDSIKKGLAEEIISELINRVNSRFLLEGNRWCAIPNIISSADEEQSVISKLFKLAENNELGIEREKILLEDATRYAVKGDVTDYSGKLFYVFTGNMMADPFIIDTKEDEERYWKVTSSPNELFAVPFEHRAEFLDIYSGIRDVLGKPVSANRTFIGSVEKVRSAAEITSIIPDEIILPNGGDLLSFFSTKQLDILKPGAQRVIGMDIAFSGDRFGLAMGHIHNSKQVGEEREDEIYIDFVTGIKPAQNEKLRLDDIRRFIYKLSEMGINIALVITDSFQSTDMLQILEEKGYKVKNHSVDRKKEAYYELRNMIYEDKIKFPNNKILIKELLNLKEDGKKVDHPQFFGDGTHGSKDEADAICQCVYGLLHEVEHNALFDEENIKDLKDKVNSYEMENYANKIKQNDLGLRNKLKSKTMEDDIKLLDQFY